MKKIFPAIIILILVIVTQVCGTSSSSNSNNSKSMAQVQAEYSLSNKKIPTVTHTPISNITPIPKLDLSTVQVDGYKIESNKVNTTSSIQDYSYYYPEFAICYECGGTWSTNDLYYSEAYDIYLCENCFEYYDYSICDGCCDVLYTDELCQDDHGCVYCESCWEWMEEEYEEEDW